MATRVCTNPDCICRGIPQPVACFYRQRVKGKLYYSSRCKACMNQASKERHHRNMARPEYREKRRISANKSYYTQKRKRMTQILERNLA